MRGIRSRLALTLLALVALTVAAIGVSTYAFVEARLREALVADVGRQAQFNLSVLLPGSDPPAVNRAQFMAAGLPEAFALRGTNDVIVDFGDDDPYYSRLALVALLDAVPQSVRETIDGGRIGYAWMTSTDGPVLVVGGRGPDAQVVLLVANAEPLEAALGQLRIGLAGAGLIAILLALATAGLIARRILRPIASGREAAGRMAAGDLSTRVPVEGRDELAGWAAEFNRMADSLQATIASLEAAQQQNRRFVADVSHELRTPLTALVAEASLIESNLEGLPTESRRAAELLVTDVRRLRTLVEDLMELSRFDADAEALRLEPVDLGRVVASIVAARLPEASLRIPERPVTVESDVRRLDRILGNLLDNARTHAPGAPVEVALERDEDHVTIEVADRGPGLAAEGLAHIFDRFYKADPSRAAADASSSGLGLAIAAEHATLLGGSLRAAAREGGGLVFRLTVPVTRSLPGGDGADTGPLEPVGISEPTARTQS